MDGHKHSPIVTSLWYPPTWTNICRVGWLNRPEISECAKFVCRFFFCSHSHGAWRGINIHVKPRKVPKAIEQWGLPCCDTWSSVLAHRSWKLNWALLIVFCPPFVCLSVDFFTFLSSTSEPFGEFQPQDQTLWKNLKIRKLKCCSLFGLNVFFNI